MKIEITEDSPILLKLVPETSDDYFNNGVLSSNLTRMKIDFRVKDVWTLVFNIDPNYHTDFMEHSDISEDR